MNEVSVVIPSKTTSNLAACIMAIRLKEPLQKRIIVVDDGIDPAFREALARDGVTFIDGERPFNFPRNINLGICASGTDDLILLNDDALLETDSGFSRLAMLSDERPEYGIISSTCNSVGNRNQLPQRGSMSRLRDEPRMVCFVCVFVPRRTIDIVGTLDERFGFYYGWDDNDYCRRIRDAGLKIGIYDGCFVDHRKLKSTFRSGQNYRSSLEDNRKVYLDKWGSLD